MEIKRTANAGVLLRLDGKQLLLDGVCSEVKPYLATPEQLRQQLLDTALDVVAFTHAHRDHYDPVFVSEYLQKAAGPILGPADIPFTSSTEQTVGNVKVMPIPSRHLGKADEVQHVSYIIRGSHCVWFLGDASPLQWKGRQDLPKPDVLIAPFAYATCGGWDITCRLDPRAFVLVHLPRQEEDPHGLWQQVKRAVRRQNGPSVYIPDLDQRIRFAD